MSELEVASTIKLKSKRVRFECYSDLEPFDEEAIPPSPPLFSRKKKNAPFKILGFITSWKLLKKHALEYHSSGLAKVAHNIIKKRLPEDQRDVYSLGKRIRDLLHHRYQ